LPAPLFKVKKGKSEFYVYNEEELVKKLNEIGKMGSLCSDIKVLVR